MHTSTHEIIAQLHEAGTKVTVGGRYAHYKDPASIYLVKELAILEADESVVVVYQAQYSDGLTFVRPLSVWLESVEWEGKTVQRFRSIS